MSTTGFSQITTCPDTKIERIGSTDPVTPSILQTRYRILGEEEPSDYRFIFNDVVSGVDLKTVFTISSPSPQMHLPAPPDYNFPASIGLLSKQFKAATGFIPTDDFNEGSIHFYTQNSEFTFMTGGIKTVDNLGGLYEPNNLGRPVSIGMAFYDCNGPTLGVAKDSPGREVFRIIDGNMGIGTTKPLHKFTVQLDPDPNLVATRISFSQTNNNPSIRFSRNTGTSGCPDESRKASVWWIELNDEWQTYDEYGSLMFKSGDAQCSDGNEVVTPKVIFTRDGRIRLGDLKYNGTSLTEPVKLSCDGGIVAKEILVTLSDWADYVFEEDYNLMNLYELESTIKKNGHLPGIPSASEVAENGIELGKMQKQMMAKIEELTLYIIELKKENDEIKKKLNEVIK